MGAVTVAIKKRRSDIPYVIADVTFSSSYATNGDTWTNAQFEVLGQVDAIVIQGNPTGYQIQPDLTNKKFIVRQGDNANAAAAPGIEVPNATNLSTLVARMIVLKDEPYV